MMQFLSGGDGREGYSAQGLHVKEKVRNEMEFQFRICYHLRFQPVIYPRLVSYAYDLSSSVSSMLVPFPPALRPHLSSPNDFRLNSALENTEAR